MLHARIGSPRDGWPRTPILGENYQITLIQGHAGSIQATGHPDRDSH